MKPIIGVTPDFNAGDREDMGGREPTYFLRARYVNAIESVGGVPLILPLADESALRRQLFKGLNGLLLTGSGPDLPPSLYGERQRHPFKIMSRRRYAFELEMIQLAVAADLPVLGICGGMQALNVGLGGTLIQDIPAQIVEPLPHRAKGPATKHAHPIRILAKSLLSRITGRLSIRVNSSHHQSVKTTAPGLVASALAPDGVIEAVESPRQRFLLGVQWHPEFLYERDVVQRKLFAAFIRAARGR
jgi:putative glutamine amidotransferase